MLGGQGEEAAGMAGAGVVAHTGKSPIKEVQRVCGRSRMAIK